jgi:hypothetical protein
MQIVYRNIRFSAKVDRCLRRRWRMHGDLSIRVREALDDVNLCDVELFEVDYRRVRATQVGVFESVWTAAHEAARARGCSVNTLVNSAVWAAFSVQRSGLRGRPRGQNRREAPVPEVCLGKANGTGQGAISTNHLVKG